MARMSNEMAEVKFESDIHFCDGDPFFRRTSCFKFDIHVGNDSVDRTQENCSLWPGEISSHLLLRSVSF